VIEPLLFLLRRFLEQITARLAHVYLGVGKLRLVLRFEAGEPYNRTFTIPQPTRDVGLLFQMLHTHLESFTSESAIIGLELTAQPVRPGTEQFVPLEKGLRDPHQLAGTLARLQALFGTDRAGARQQSQRTEAHSVCLAKRGLISLFLHREKRLFNNVDFYRAEESSTYPPPRFDITSTAFGLVFPTMVLVAEISFPSLPNSP
jgi:hypothetical protein